MLTSTIEHARLLRMLLRLASFPIVALAAAAVM